MLVDTLKEILQNHRNSITINELEKVLKNKKIEVRVRDFISRSKVFHLSNDIVFLKSSLIETKNIFLTEFHEYLETRALSKKVSDNIVNLLNYFIPDIFYPYWKDINIENKITVFNMLFNFFVKSKKSNEKIVKFFHRLIEVYSLFTVYALLLLKNNEIGLDKTTDFVSSIESLEDRLKVLLFELLTLPLETDMRVSTLMLNDIEEEIEERIQMSFSSAISYSSVLFKRVIENEMQNFEFLYILTRFDFNNLFEWLLLLSEKDQTYYNEKLFRDFEID